MEKFTHGVMVVQPSLKNEDGIPVVHFVGYWEEPNRDDIDALITELEEDEDFAFRNEMKAGELELYPATQEILDYYNSVINKKENL
jgi:hypothetical protein